MLREYYWNYPEPSRGKIKKEVKKDMDEKGQSVIQEVFSILVALVILFFGILMIIIIVAPDWYAETIAPLLGLGK